MRNRTWVRTIGVGGWLLAACGPGKGQPTSETETSGGSASSGATDTSGGTSGGSSGGPTTSGGPTDTGLDTADETTGVPGTGGSTTAVGTTTSAASTTLVETTTSAGTTVGSTGDDTTTGGGGLIECNGCTCDPAVSYCQVTWSPTMDPPPEHPSGACPFITAGSYDYGCVAYTPECGQDPSCDCVPETEPVCGCMDAGPYLYVNCDYP